MRSWTCLVIALAMAWGLTGPASAQLDYGDFSSATLTGKAWSEMGSQNYEAALGYIAKCLELYEAQAKTMQAGLSDYPPNTPPEETSKFWALNDVGTCLFIRGEIELKRGDQSAAKATFQKLVNELKYAQCWDTNGWFWKPADAAKKKILELEFEQP